MNNQKDDGTFRTRFKTIEEVRSKKPHKVACYGKKKSKDNAET